MKMLHIIPTMDPKAGGPCQGLRYSIPQLKSLGSTNEVVCLDNANSSYLSEESFRIYALGKSKGLWQYQSDLISWLRANMLNYDVVIIHALWLFHGYAVHKVVKEFEKKNISIRYFVIPHGMLDSYFQKAASRKLKTIRNIIYWKLIESKIIEDAFGVLFTCQEELLIARKTFKYYKPKREINISYGVSIPSSLGNNNFFEKNETFKDKPFILFLGRIHEKKGVDILVDAYIQLLTTIKNIELPNLVIAGPGMDSNFGREILKKVHSKKDLGNRIIFKGMLEGDIKWETFYGCEAFILPSHQENFGIAVAEALACGKPVLISDKINIWREIKDGEAGIIENDSLLGTISLLKQWIELSNPQKEEMSNNALRCYNENFTIAGASSKMYTALSDLLEVK